MEFGNSSQVYTNLSIRKSIEFFRMDGCKVRPHVPSSVPGAMNKFYYKRDKEWSFEKYLKRINEMTALEKTITPVLENFDSIVYEEINQRKD